MNFCNNVKTQVEYIFSLDRSVKNISEALRTNSTKVNKIELDVKGLCNVISSIQILNETIRKTIKEENDLLIKSTEDAIKSVHEKIDEIENNLKDIRDKVTTHTTNYLDEAQKKIIEICEETLNTIKNVWDEFKKIR